jgi:hypothetical protein
MLMLKLRYMQLILYSNTGHRPIHLYVFAIMSGGPVSNSLRVSTKCLANKNQDQAASVIQSSSPGWRMAFHKISQPPRPVPTVSLVQCQSNLAHRLDIQMTCSLSSLNYKRIAHKVRIHILVLLHTHYQLPQLHHQLSTAPLHQRPRPSVQEPILFNQVRFACIELV